MAGDLWRCNSGTHSLVVTKSYQEGNHARYKKLTHLPRTSQIMGLWAQATITSWLDWQNSQMYFIYIYLILPKRKWSPHPFSNKLLFEVDRDQGKKTQLVKCGEEVIACAQPHWIHPDHNSDTYTSGTWRAGGQNYSKSQRTGKSAVRECLLEITEKLHLRSSTVRLPTLAWRTMSIYMLMWKGGLSWGSILREGNISN